MNYYQILSVSHTATQDEIKKAYRKLAKLHHPDVAEKNSKVDFKGITVAYDTLSNEKKREDYDLSLSGELISSFNINETFDKFKDIFARSQSRRNTSVEQPPSSAKRITIKVKLYDVYIKKIKTLKLKEKEDCKECNGIGFRKTYGCSKCDGTGVKVKYKSGVLGYSKVNEECENCKGKGRVPERKKDNLCFICNGTGKGEQNEKLITINIPENIQYKFQYYISGYNVIFEKDETENFEVDKQGDIHSHQYIGIKQLILGGKVKIKTITGLVEIEITPNSYSKEYRLKGKGTTTEKNLYVELFPFIPNAEDLNDYDKTQLNNLNANISPE